MQDFVLFIFLFAVGMFVAKLVGGFTSFRNLNILFPLAIVGYLGLAASRYRDFLDGQRYADPERLVWLWLFGCLGILVGCLWHLAREDGKKHQNNK